MTHRSDSWPDLVQQALFETDPVLQQQRTRKAKQAIQDRLLELDVEQHMLQEASKKLDALH
jgi:hypothetical protein